MPIAKCLICGTELYVKPSHQKRGWGKYCSISCRTKSQLNGKSVSCFICEKEVYRSLKGLRNSKSNKFFCTKTCQTVWRNTILFVGKNHSNWKFGESAYRSILESTGKGKMCTLCMTNDSRILIVHHIDKNRKNNNVSNLTWLCHNCHYLVHHFKDTKDKLKSLIK